MHRIAKEVEKPILRNFIFLNNIENMIFNELIKRFSYENTSKTKTKLLATISMKYLEFKKDEDELLESKGFFNSKYSEVSKSPNQIKEFVQNNVEEFYKSIYIWW